MKDQIFYVGQKALIEKDGKVLILFLPNGWLDFPGGKIQEGETDIDEALKREVREETGLEIELGDPFCKWWFELDSSKSRTTNKVFLVGIKCRYISGDLNVSTEHKGFEWVDKENYKEFDDGRKHFKALEEYFSQS